jgi:hypothetical protein
MSGQTVLQLPIAEIPTAFFEYRADFLHPIFSAWYGRGDLVTALHGALLPWQIGLEDVTWNATPKNLREAQVTINIRTLSVIINVGLGGVTMVANDPDWSKAEALISLFQAVLDSLKTVGKTQFGMQSAVLAFHVRPAATPFREVMKRFVNTKALGKEDATMYGVGFYSPEYTVIFDNSGVVPDGVFVRITRVFPPATRFDQIASILHKDETEVLARLGFRLQ